MAEMKGERYIVSATIFLHPSLLRRIPMGDIVRRLERAGYALSNVRAKHHSYEARMIRKPVRNAYQVKVKSWKPDR